VLPFHSYLIALGSNQRHGRYGAPEGVLSQALDNLDVNVVSQSPIISSAPIGPSKRRYANAVAIIETRMGPPELLNHLKAIEASFGRRPGGRRWASRVLDLDIILWSGGLWSTSDLSIPHPAFRQRGFVLGPSNRIAGNWRDPITGLRVKHLLARLDRKQTAA
jgi:2-amino-4-hydroxy-6-hydroxymethyldihydropteridine diphosphokinase